MDEAEYLAERIIVVAAGTIVAHGTPATLGGRHAMPSTITFTLPPGVAATELPAPLHCEELPARRVSLDTTTPLTDVERLAVWARDRQLDLPDLQVTRPSLEDVYLDLVKDQKR